MHDMRSAMPRCGELALVTLICAEVVTIVDGIASEKDFQLLQLLASVAPPHLGSISPQQNRILLWATAEVLSIFCVEGILQDLVHHLKTSSCRKSFHFCFFDCIALKFSVGSISFDTDGDQNEN
mmetsp:Transcript_14763/g.20534  ORF Transcript_14763/g.20534 Transcript_14763/m.20534 type:complete len:124 (+) Transcript_14763:94-465(+)